MGWTLVVGESLSSDDWSVVRKVHLSVLLWLETGGEHCLSSFGPDTDCGREFGAVCLFVFLWLNTSDRKSLSVHHSMAVHW